MLNMASGPSPSAIQQRVWDGRLPLEILLAPSECRTYDQADPYLISYPRLSYLPFLLPRLHAFFTSSLIDPDSKPHHGWFSFEGVPLKWHYPVGLLYDLYAGAEPITSKSDSTPPRLPAALGGSTERSSDEERGRVLPWRLVVHFNDWPEQDLIRLDPDGRVLHDAFINSVKEADFLRNGTAKGIMTLSKEDSDGLWNSVREHDLQTHQRVTSLLLPPPSTPLRNLPLRIFLPSSPTPTDPDETPTTTPSKPTFSNPSLKVIQSPFPPTTTATSTKTTSPPPAGSGTGISSSMTTSTRPKSKSTAPQTQTIGSVLHDLLPTLFPSRRIPVLAKPVLHGAAVPMGTAVEDLVRCGGGYADGWVCVVVYMVG